MRFGLVPKSMTLNDLELL